MNIRSILPLALLSFAACKQTGGLDEGTVEDPATAERDAGAPAPADAGPVVPPFDWTSLFPQRDAGRAPARPVDAGRAPAPTTLRVGAQGGVLTADGIALDVPRGALTRTIEITFAELPSPPAGFSGRAWLLSPPATRFAVPAHVAIWFTPELLQLAPPSEWAVATLQNGAWVALPDQTNDADDALVFASTQVLGPFALIRVPARDGVAPGSDAGEGDAGGADAGVSDAGGLDGGSIDAEIATPDDAAVDAGPTPFCLPGACTSGTCVEGVADYSCTCNTGYAAAVDLHSCADVDECAQGLGVCVIVGTVCVNDVGTYHCACVAPNVLLPSGTCGLAP
ncbi:MAG TPA: hypothetical protein VFX59_00190 [Polyangiales bacterium]|nr:hypothetical protein [Polyangiales bacterium]